MSETDEIKTVLEKVKAKQETKRRELEEQIRTGMIYPKSMPFLTKDTAEKSIISLIYKFTDLKSLTLKQFYNLLSKEYSNADKYKNLIYYHYYFKLNHPLKYYKTFFSRLSDEQQRAINEDSDFLENVEKDESEMDERGKKILNDYLVSKLLNDYKTTKKTYEVFLENINKEYSNLHEFVMKMSTLSTDKKPTIKKVEKKKEEPLTLEQFLVRTYLKTPDISTEKLLKEAKAVLPKQYIVKNDKLIKIWYEIDEDDVLKNIDFVIDDYKRSNKGKISEESIFDFLKEKLNKNDSELEDVKALIKRKLKKQDKKAKGDEDDKKVPVDEPQEDTEEKEEAEEEEEEEEEEKDEEEEEKDYGEESEAEEEEKDAFDQVEDDEGYTREQPAQFKRKNQMDIKESQIYGSKITGLLKTIKIENDKIRIRKAEEKKNTQQEPYRILSQLDNDYQIGMWIKNYKQTWIIPVETDDESKYILSSETLDYKNKVWYKPTKLWFILQCNLLSHKRELNKNKLTCFYYDTNAIEQKVEFKVLYELENDEFVDINDDILNDEELWKKSRTKPRLLVDYYKNKILEQEDYGIRKIALNNLTNVLSVSSKIMMVDDESSKIANEIEQRIFSDNQNETLNKYFTDVSKVIVFLDPSGIGNYALNFRYKVHSGEIKASSIHGKLAREFLLPEIFGADIVGKDEISQIIDRTVVEQRTSMFYELISNIYNLNISIAAKALEINNIVSCSNEDSKLYDDAELLHYVDNGQLYCFSVYEMSDKIKNNDLVNQHTNKPFRDQFVSYVTSLLDIEISTKKESTAAEIEFDLLKEIDDFLDDIEDTCICGQAKNDKFIKSVVPKPNGNFKEKMFCSVKCMDKYDF
jgi:hypothetical protein